MSHEIEIVDGRACIAYNGETPWHGLGFEVDADMTPAEMMVAAGVDWTVALRSCFAEMSVGGGKVKRVSTAYKALIRESDLAPLTVTGASWHPIQNSEAFDFFADFVEKGELEMHTAGSLRGGRMVWAMAKAKQEFSLFKGKDRVETNLLFYNPHEYGKSAGVMVTPTRVVCNNTLTLALSSKKNTEFHARISHRKRFNPEEVHATMTHASMLVDQYRQQAELLASRKLEAEAFKEFTLEVFPSKSDDKPSRLAEITQAVLDTQPGAQLGAGTWWQAVNAVTFTMDHLMGKQYSTETSDTPMRDRRLSQSWFGAVARDKQRALALAVTHANKAGAA